MHCVFFLPFASLSSREAEAVDSALPVPLEPSVGANATPHSPPLAPRPPRPHGEGDNSEEEDDEEGDEEDGALNGMQLLFMCAEGSLHSAPDARKVNEKTEL